MGLEILIQFHIIDPSYKLRSANAFIAYANHFSDDCYASIVLMSCFVWWFRKICKLSKVVELAPRTGFTRCFEILTTGNLDLTVHIWTQYAVYAYFEFIFVKEGVASFALGFTFFDFN